MYESVLQISILTNRTKCGNKEYLFNNENRYATFATYQVFVFLSVTLSITTLHPLSLIYICIYLCTLTLTSHGIYSGVGQRCQSSMWDVLNNSNSQTVNFPFVLFWPPLLLPVMVRLLIIQMRTNNFHCHLHLTLHFMDIVSVINVPTNQCKIIIYVNGQSEKLYSLIRCTVVVFSLERKKM